MRQRACNISAVTLACAESAVSASISLSLVNLEKTPTLSATTGRFAMTGSPITGDALPREMDREREHYFRFR